MIHVRVSELEEEIKFAQKAAKCFCDNPKFSTYTIDDPKPGCLLAIRWGVGLDCVLVVRLDDIFEPKVFAQIIPKEKK